MAFDLKQNQDLYNQTLQHLKTDVQVPWAWRPGQDTFDAYTGQVNQLGSQFSNSFQNLVGRAPTQDELNKFVTDYVIPHTNDLAQPGSMIRQNPSTYLNDFVGNTFQGAAKDYATQQLTDQQGQANFLADQYRQQGNQSINQTQQSLLDFQSQLFDKLRPNLITSLQSQGLLDTGGLNQAMAGAQKDLANSASGYLMDARLQNENAANQIAFAGASAPFQYKQNNIMNQVPYMQQQGQQAMSNGYNNFLTNMNYQNQLGLMAQQNKYQEGMQPSFLRTLGQSFAGSLGQAGGQWFSPNPSGQGGSSGGRNAQAAAMLG